MSHFMRISTQFQDLTVLSQALGRLGLAAYFNTEVYDFYDKSIGVKPLVVPTPQEWSADLYFEQTECGFEPHIDHMDQARYNALNLPQVYAQVMIERFAAQHGMFINSSISEDGTVEYQLIRM